MWIDICFVSCQEVSLKFHELLVFYLRTSMRLLNSEKFLRFIAVLLTLVKCQTALCGGCFWGQLIWDLGTIRGCAHLVKFTCFRSEYFQNSKSGVHELAPIKMVLRKIRQEQESPHAGTGKRHTACRITCPGWVPPSPSKVGAPPHPR